MTPVLRLLPALVLFTAGCGEGASTDPTDQVPDEPRQYDADPHVDTYLPDNYRATDPARVIYLGDSITAGAGASAPGLNYTDLLVTNDDGTWDGWGEQDLESLFGDIEVVDVSVGGARTGSLIGRQLPNLSDKIGDSVSGETIVVITIGGNDMQAAMVPMITANDKEAAYEEQIRPTIDNFGTIIDYFQDSARFPDGAFVYMTNVYEPTDNEGQTPQCFFGVDLGPVLPYLDRANGEFRDLAIERGIAMVDLRGHFLGHGHNYDTPEMEPYDGADPTLWLADDCIHPNDRGHHEVRRLFLTAIDGRPLEAFGEAP